MRSLTEAILSMGAVMVVSLVLAAYLGRACLLVVAGKLRAETAARQQCTVLLVLLAVSWVWTLLGAAGIIAPSRHGGMPLHAFVPLSITASLVPLPAWSVAMACDLPGLARMQRVVPRAWAIIALVAALTWPLLHAAAEVRGLVVAGLVVLMLATLMHFVVVPVLAVAASVPVSVAAWRRGGGVVSSVLANVLVAWIVTFTFWLGRWWPGGRAWMVHAPALLIVAATFFLMPIVSRRATGVVPPDA